jgi:acetolactate synthase-1/2/3 large subunit
MTGHGVRQMGVQEIGIVPIVSSITKYAVTVTDPTQMRYHLERALYLAQTGRPGPVWLDIPLDVQAARIDPASQAGYAPDLPSTALGAEELSALVAQAIQLFNVAERPVLLAGNGIRLAHAEALFRALADTLDIPLLTTWPALDLLPESHPYNMGRPGAMAPRGANFTLQNADWLLTVGARLDRVQTGFSHERFARAARKVMVDIDPAEIGKMTTPIDVAICADAKDFLAEFTRQRAQITRKDRTCWVARCRAWKSSYPIIQPEYRQTTGGVSTYVFVEALNEELAESDIIVQGSSGNHSEVFFLTFAAKEGQRVCQSRGLGAMGFGLPASIGFCLASGRRRTICMDGDGGVQLNIQELETLARLQLPIKLFIINNEGFASIRAMQRNHFQGHFVACDTESALTVPNLPRVAAAYGLATARIATATDIRAQIRAVLATPGPVLCEVIVPRDEVRAPSLSSKARPDGSMVSAPLEDLAPFLPREELRANMLIPMVEE